MSAAVAAAGAPSVAAAGVASAVRASCTFQVNAVAECKVAAGTVPAMTVITELAAEPVQVPPPDHPIASRSRGAPAAAPAPPPRPHIVDAGGVSPNAISVKLLREQRAYSPNAFVNTVVKAFDEHRPLVLKPSHFWLLISQSVGKIINDNAEELRKQFVMHEGKKTLIVHRDGFSRGARNDWAGVVGAPADGFAKQIRDNTVPGVMDIMSPAFSEHVANPGCPEKIACEIAVMSALQKFFDYRCMTCCGFPRITLLGTVADWELLQSSAAKLVSTKMTPAIAAVWAPALESVLGRIVATVKLQHASETPAPLPAELVQFWSSMCKRGGVTGSGGYTFLSGWINAFFPSGGACVPYEPTIWYAKPDAKFSFGMGGDRPRGPLGMHDDSIPSGFCAAPVAWDYLSTTYDLEFKAGFFTRVLDDGISLTPEVMWFIRELPQAGAAGAGAAPAAGSKAVRH